MVIAGCLPLIDLKTLIPLSWPEIMSELKLLEDFSLLECIELNHRLNVYTEFSLMVKEEMQDIILIDFGLEKDHYEFILEYKDIYDDLVPSDFKNQDPVYHGNTVKYRNFVIKYDHMLEAIARIEAEINKRKK